MCVSAFFGQLKVFHTSAAGSRRRRAKRAVAELIWGFGVLTIAVDRVTIAVDRVTILLVSSRTKSGFSSMTVLKAQRSYAYFILNYIEKSGKTLHLLKSGSKPIKPRSKRKKIEILGTLAQFNDSKKKPVLPSQSLSQTQQPPPA